MRVFGRGRGRAEIEERLELYARARSETPWNPRTDIDWDSPSKLPEDLQSVACQLANTSTYFEEVGLLTAGRLLTEIDDMSARLSLATQVSDEAKHSEAFGSYIHFRGLEVDPSPSTAVEMLEELAAIQDPLALFIVHTMLEGLALDQFALLNKLLTGDPIATIYRFVRRDEARHVAMGMDYLKFALRQPVSDEVIQTLIWCEANTLSIAQLTPAFMAWMAEVSKRSSSEIEKLFISHHERRMQQIWQHLLWSGYDDQEIDCLRAQGQLGLYRRAEDRGPDGQGKQRHLPG